jgi:hypothetical protein
MSLGPFGCGATNFSPGPMIHPKVQKNEKKNENDSQKKRKAPDV